MSWEGLKRFLAGEGNIHELEKIELDDDGESSASKRRAGTGD